MPGEKPLKILHVDDEKNQLEFTKLFLEQIEKDVIVDSVNNPEEALKRQEKENYDCIISDYKMMSMNGIELAQKVRKKSDVPFILYTGHGSEEVAELAFSSGIDDYLRKETEPTHYQVLAKRIKETVEKHRLDELYKKVVEESRDAIIIIVKNKVAFLNRAACSLVGINSVEECIGEDVFEFFLDESEKIFPPSLDEEGNYNLKMNYRTSYGTIRNADVNISKIRYRGEDAYLCFIRDITEQRRNRERLNAIYQQAIKLSTAGDVQEISEITLDIMETVFDYHTLTFHIVDGNNLKTLGTRGGPSFELVLPLNGQGITTKAARETQSIMVSDVSECSDFVKGNMDSGSELAVPAVLNGETLAVLNAESKEVDNFTKQDKKLLETLSQHVAFAFNRIKTERLREKEEKNRSQRLDYALGVLDHTEKVSTLVSGDLQNNLLSIMNATGVMRIQPDMMNEILDSIEENADKAYYTSDLVREILDKLTRIKGYIEVNHAIRTILEKKRFPKNIRVNTQYDESILIVEIGEEKFTRIIDNLLMNAVEAMPGGGSLYVKVNGRKTSAQIDICDTGKGIPEERQEKIFEPFNSTKDGHTGLGLAFCKNAAESIGGDLKLEKSSDKDTRFRLWLPLIKID
ncbi:response regulator [Candidatus Bathyarchaeota archaeon]|nr:response regulator [Candidatus Bathyarchaeota archaeon]